LMGDCQFFRTMSDAHFSFLPLWHCFSPARAEQLQAAQPLCKAAGPVRDPGVLRRARSGFCRPPAGGVLSVSTPRHATPRHRDATPRHATPRHATPHATPRHATPRHATPATPRHATLLSRSLQQLRVKQRDRDDTCLQLDLAQTLTYYAKLRPDALRFYARFES
jgi:hypothetical protein